MIKFIIEPINLYIKQILSLGGFKVTDLKPGIYKELLTAFQDMPNHDVIMISEFLNMIKSVPGKLILDDTGNPKYGLKKIARKFKNLSTGGYHQGYKILLFLWDTGNNRIPIGFALYHKGSKTINKLTRKGISLLRNTHKIRPEMVLADGAFFTNETAKLLNDYGWEFVMRFNKARKLSNETIKKLIPRGYGSEKGILKNGTKVKVFRRKNRFYTCNRMLRTMIEIVKSYALRWKIEEVFRVLKVCLGLNRCQQHSLVSQEIYIFMCLLLFTCADKIKGSSIYKVLKKGYFDELNIKNILKKDFLAIN